MPDGLVLVRVPKTTGTHTRTQNQRALSGFRVPSSHLTWELKGEVTEGGEEGPAR